MNLQEKIFNEIKNCNIKTGDLWVVQRCLKFQNELNPMEQENFEMVMNQLCDEGFFSKEKYVLGITQYFLTEKGEKYIYN